MKRPGVIFGPYLFSMNEIQDIAELAELGIKHVAIECDSKAFATFQRKVAKDRKIPAGFSIEFHPNKIRIFSDKIEVIVNSNDYVPSEKVS